MEKMKKGIVIILLFLPALTRGEEPSHRLFLYPKIGFSSNLSNRMSFLIGPSLIYRLSVLKGLGLSWNLLYLYSSVDKTYTSDGTKSTHTFTVDTFLIEVGLFYEIPYYLTEELSLYAEAGTGLVDAIIEGNAPDYNARNSFITWEFYAGGGLMYRLKRGLVSGGIRMGYAPLGGYSPLTINMSGIQIFAGYTYEF